MYRIMTMTISFRRNIKARTLNNTKNTGTIKISPSPFFRT